MQKYIDLFEDCKRTLLSLCDGEVRPFVELTPAQKLAYLTTVGAYMQLQLQKGNDELPLVDIYNALWSNLKGV